MRVVQRHHVSRLMKSAAIIAVAGVATGCSSNVMRFQDGFFTGSIKRERPAVAAVQQPAFDQNQADFRGSAAHQDVEPVNAAPRAVTRNVLPPAAGAARQASKPLIEAEPGIADANDAAPAPVVSEVAAIEPAKKKVDAVKTAAVEPAKPEPKAKAKAVETASADIKPSRKEGWSSAGGTYVELGEGETIYNLSRRFGVPANAIMEANDISDAGAVRAGQKLLIPTYVYSRTAAVSAPDNDPNTAKAKSSKGVKAAELPADKLPSPDQVPSREVAVLPATPSTKERKSGEDATLAADAKPKEAAKPQAAAEAKPAAGGSSYTVKEGDSLYAISKKTGVSVADIKSANALKDGRLKIGQTLALRKGKTVAALDTGIKTDAVEAPVPNVTAADKPAAGTKQAELPQYTPPKADEKVIEQAEQDVATAAPSATGVSKMRWPAKGKIIAGYGARTGAGKNAGIDIALPKGTPVKAAENGVVIYAGDGLKEFGKTVLVRHENGLVSVYGHVDTINVQRGATIKRGQEIAMSGMTGNADAPKLHFEVRKNSKPVDPAEYLE